MAWTRVRLRHPGLLRKMTSRNAYDRLVGLGRLVDEPVEVGSGFAGGEGVHEAGSVNAGMVRFFVLASTVPGCTAAGSSRQSLAMVRSQSQTCRVSGRDSEVVQIDLDGVRLVCHAGEHFLV
jgi:hypothetical protein